jgi:hypothetical protein
MRRIALVGLAAVIACAGAGESVAPPPSPFRGVQSLVLVRAADDRASRPKDPLDGLQESLAARGFTTRVVDLGGKRPPELAPLERLFDQLEARAAAGRLERSATPVSSLGRDVAATVAGLGVDAVASYHRLDRHRSPSMPPSMAPGTTFPAPATASPQRPTGALVLVDRQGRVAAFAWGDAGALEDPSVPLNAAEAIDQLVHALTGEE